MVLAIPLVKIKSLNKEINVTKGKNLMVDLIESDVFIDNPCNGKGTCGKCKVKIVSNTIKGPCKEEIRLLGSDDIDNSIP